MANDKKGNRRRLPFCLKWLKNIYKKVMKTQEKNVSLKHLKIIE